MIKSRLPRIEPKEPTPAKVTLSSSVFFDVDQPILETFGIAMLKDFGSKIHGMNIEVAIVVGHVDSTESSDLSIARAEFVKEILGGIGIEKNRIYSEGKGDKVPVANNTTEQGQAKNRRVEIEIVGSR
jgi:OOP family OmpA-OmpF porin